MAGSIENRLSELGIELPKVAKPLANYLPFVVTGNLVFVSGQLPMWDGELMLSGKLGDNIQLTDEQAAARYCGLNLLAQVKEACYGDLDRVMAAIKLGVFVNSTADFTEQAKVINGASALMFEIFENKGKHARSAVSCPSLPLGSSVEIDGVFEFN